MEILNGIVILTEKDLLVFVNGNWKLEIGNWKFLNSLVILTEEGSLNTIDKAGNDAEIRQALYLF